MGHLKTEKPRQLKSSDAHKARSFAGKNPKRNIMKETTYSYRSEPKPLYYEVVNASGEVLFKNECRAICNSWICSNMIQGVRPKPVYDDENI